MSTTNRLQVPEREFQAQVLQLAKLSGWFCYHTHDSRRSAAGFPDLVLVRAPRVLFAELKSEKGQTRPEQAAWLEALRGCRSVEVALWRPRDWPEKRSLHGSRERRSR